MKPFGLAEPESLSEALALLAESADGAARPLAGGTALALMMKPGILQPDRLISLRRIEARYSSIEQDEGGALLIGALTPLRQIELSDLVRGHAPVVNLALKRLSNVRVRNVATIGGHLAHGDPHLDLPPVLIALGAEITISGPSGERIIAVEDLFRSYLETALESVELITSVRIPPQGGRRAAYIKHTTRSADDWPALGIAVSLDVDGEAVRDARVAIGAASEIPLRLKSVEQVLAGKALDDRTLEAAGEAASGETTVHSDARGSAPYKRELIRVFTGRAIRNAMDAAVGGQS